MSFFTYFPPWAETLSWCQRFFTEFGKKERGTPQKCENCEIYTFSLKVRKVLNLMKIAEFTDFHDFGLQTIEKTLRIPLLFTSGETDLFFLIFLQFLKKK